MKKNITTSCRKYCLKPILKASPTHAFTLAELLIVLVIIGVVASLTIPAVITRTNSEQLTAGAKKSYNTVKTAIKAAEQNKGSRTGWTGNMTSNSQVFQDYLKNYLDILSDCATGTGCFASPVTNLSGTPVGISNAYTFMTADGMAWAYVHSDVDTERLLYVDVNGFKKPNRLGRDIFIYSMGGTRNTGTRIESLIGEPYRIISSEDGSLVDDCTSGGAGESCLIKIIREGKMNY